MTKGPGPSKADSGFVRTMLTEDKANKIWDPLRVAFVVGFATIIVLQFYTVIGQGNAFDTQAFGIGVGTYLTATGLALWSSSRQQEPAK